MAAAFVFGVTEIQFFTVTGSTHAAVIGAAQAYDTAFKFAEVFKGGPFAFFSQHAKPPRINSIHSPNGLGNHQPGLVTS